MSWQLYRRICSPLLLLLWIFTVFHNVKGVPSDSIVMKARCYANCFTQNTPANKTEKSCQSSSCEECLIPCGAPFSDEDTCKQSCNNASSCLKSCAFLAQVQNFSSILAGDGSLPPTPGIPTVTSRNFTSISLKWDPVQNMSGAVVYLIEITFTGELSRHSPRYLPEVFVSSQATVKFEHPCVYTARGVSRTEYTDIFFRFKIAVLTGNSSVSYGPQTSQITLTKPDSVTNVSLDSIVYDSANPGDKIKLTFSFIPPKDQKDLISLYGAFFVGSDPSCEHPFLPRTEDSNGAEATISMHIFHKSLKCIHRVEIYSIVGCSVSDPTVFNYTYPGCNNITDFPVSECYKFDPPYAPLEDRMVSNVTLEGPMTAQQDYRFTAVVTWNRPVYPYKSPTRYFMNWKKEGDILPQGSFSSTNSQTITNLLPETSYILKITPMFPDGKPLTDWTTITLTTPACFINGISCKELICEESENQNSPIPPINE